MELIQTVTVGSGGATSISFSSIPATFTDIVLVYSLRGSASSTDDNVYLTVNGSVTNINGRYLYGNGSSAASDNWANYNLIDYIPGNTTTSNTFGNGSVYFPNYGGSTNKSFSVDSVGENNATAARQSLIAGLVNTTSAITSLSIKPNGTNTFMQYSTASLYGILKGSGGATVS